MLQRSAIRHHFKWRRGFPPKQKHWWRTGFLRDPPKPIEIRDPRTYSKDRLHAKIFAAPQWDMWKTRARSEDMDEALQPLMDMPATLKARRYDIPWWANPFGAWYLQNILAVELLKLPSRSNTEKIAIYRGELAGKGAKNPNPNLIDDDILIKRQISERWRKLEFGERSKGHPCSFPDYIQFLNEWFKSLDEEGMQRLREHFDRKIRPLLSVMTHVDILWLESRTQNTTVDKELERRIASQTTLATPEFFDIANRLRYEINEDYKVRDELGPELFALWSKAPERWPPERLSKMYNLDFTLVRKILVWHHFKACYDSCVEPDWTLPKRLFAHEWVRDVRAREMGKFYGRLRFAEKGISFYNDTHFFKDYLNRREATYGNVWEMDDPYRFLQNERDFENYWGDNYDMFRRIFPEMVGRSGEPVQQLAPQANWAGPFRSLFEKQRHNYLFAEIGLNVGHEPLKRLELDPTNEKRRRFIIRQPDGKLRSAKMSEMRSWYHREQWADFRFWTPYLPWSIHDTPSAEAYEEPEELDTPDANVRRLRRIQSRPVKWFYEAQHTNVGEDQNVPPNRALDQNQRYWYRWPRIAQSGTSQFATQRKHKVIQVVNERVFQSGQEWDMQKWSCWDPPNARGF